MALNNDNVFYGKLLWCHVLTVPTSRQEGPVILLFDISGVEQPAAKQLLRGLHCWQSLMHWVELLPIKHGC